MRVVDLFCGAGGFSEGFHRAGFEIIRAYDIWEPAIITHNMNHSEGKPVAQKRNVLEIAWLDDEEFEEAIPDSEIIIGSPPCIAFSNSNKSGKADKALGIKLIEAFLRIVARKKFKKNSKLKYWVMENVGNSQKYIKDVYTMNDLGLDELTNQELIVKNPHSKIYNMKYYGVPTNRERYICGEFPEVPETNSKEEVISLGEVLKVLGTPMPNEYENTSDIIHDPNYGIVINRSELTDHHYISELAEFEWKKAERQKRDKGYMGKMSFPEDLTKPARTIMATMSTSSRESMIFSLNNEKNRYRLPTIREIATLMSFPLDYRFYGENSSVKYRMVGNAVTPKFAYHLAKSIILDYQKTNLDYKIHDKYKEMKSFPTEPDFYNLNGIIFPTKEEKPKKSTAKYKYHVPYLIENAFRVELENNVDILTQNVKWEVSIHRGQGKTAKVYKKVEIPDNFFTESVYEKIKSFIRQMVSLINNGIELQKYFCKTTNERQGYIGPDELLEYVKMFVIKFDGDQCEIDNINKPVPYKILMSYFILENILIEINIDGGEFHGDYENTKRELAY